MIGRDSKQIYEDEDIDIAFYSEKAYKKFVITFHIINPLKFLIAGFFIGIADVLAVAVFKAEWYYGAILPLFLMAALFSYRRYLNN